ncbi:integrase core domain protein, partial [Lasius niger]
DVEIPRHYFGSLAKINIENIQLHCFVDASEKAYGAVVYFRYHHKNALQSRMVVSKSRVAPLKKLSLPRLELMAALIGVRLSKTVQRYFKEQLYIVPYYWSDSSIVLHWVKGSPERWKPFVQNRTREIQEKSEPASWRYCPTEQNPADMLTRDLSIASLKEEKSWWFGPEWLTSPECSWPKMTTSSCKEEEVLTEKREKVKKVLQSNCTTEQVNKLFNPEKFSNLSKILRITAWIRRFLHNAKNKEKQFGPLTAEELEKSETYWIKNTQEEYFAEEIKALISKNPLAKESRIKKFNPFLDGDQVIRVGGRLQHADLMFSEKHPIILPEQSYFADLTTKCCHEKTGHSGIAGTLLRFRRPRN